MTQVRSSEAGELEVDLLDPGFYQGDPHPAFTWMRANEPVYRDEANGLWAVTRHADVHDVEARSRRALCDGVAVAETTRRL